MLHELERFRASLHKEYSVADLTVVIGVRAHERNPWVIERLAAIAGYYQPCPAFLVVDLGSKEPFASALREACDAAGLSLVRVEDEGTFSPARARNIGATHVETALVFFSDVDCLGERDLFVRLIRHANAVEMGTHLDRIAVLPVYFLSEAVSLGLSAELDPERRSSALSRAFERAVLGEVGKTVQFVDPQSNFLLLRRDFFDYVGGFNDSFRGHGSEDFEFLLRVASYSLQFPRPERVEEDGVRPGHDAFYGPKRYTGFRRLFELMCEPAQLAGLRIAHLFHERKKDETGWYEQNDWSRRAFTEQVVPVLSDRSKLLDYDFLPREKRALVLVRQPSHADFFFPLRLAGFALERVHAADVNELERAAALIQAGKVDAVAVFNPYMSSHRVFAGLVALARERGLRMIVVERGAFPESWYYAPDISYGDPEFSALRLDEQAFTIEELALSDAYAVALRSGRHTLEQNGSYDETRARIASVASGHRTKLLVPLQLDDDIATTRFTEGFCAYADLVQQIEPVARQHPEVLFMVKAHPLSRVPFRAAAANVHVCSDADNIHALLDASDGVVCYNSGVGLLALVHHKPLVTLGNAYYNVDGVGQRAASLREALSILTVDGLGPPSEAKVRALVAFLVCRKYSFFHAESSMREGARRRIHDYRNMLWYQVNLDGTRTASRAGASQTVDPRCYATARMGIGNELERRGHEAYGWQSIDPRRFDVRPPTASRAKLKKLLREPRRFFGDSRLAPLRALAKWAPADDSPALRRLEDLASRARHALKKPRKR